MPDVCDLSEGFNQLALECAHAQLRAAPTLPDSHGKCLNCVEPIALDHHFCCVECRDDYERIEAARRRNGRQ